MVQLSARSYFSPGARQVVIFLLKIGPPHNFLLVYPRDFLSLFFFFILFDSRRGCMKHILFVFEIELKSCPT